ncbi:hypothetical protein FBR02_01165 [Anaerolineae bacterium CFX9]|nr:hypothetical protein [Anaerolineae bacterium CFX9]
MQNDPKNRDKGGSSPRRSFTGKTAAERRAERRAQGRAEGTAETGAARATGTTGAVSPASTTAASSRDRKVERAREKRRRQIVTIGAAVVVLVVVVVGLILYLSIPDEAPVPEAARTRYQDISAGTTEEGYPRLGSPTAAVQVALYTSFDCATCKAFYEAVIDDMLARVRSEQIAFTFVPLFGQGTTVQNGQGAARAAICAGQQGQFWQFTEMLYDWQGQFPNNLVYRSQRISAGVNNIGLNGGAFDSCRNSSLPDEVLDRARQAASNLQNFTIAPTMAINGVVPVGEDGAALTLADDVIAAVDQEIARVLTAPATPDPAQPPAESTPAPAAEATAESTAEPTDVSPTPQPELTAEATPEAEATEAGS